MYRLFYRIQDDLYLDRNAFYSMAKNFGYAMEDVGMISEKSSFGTVPFNNNLIKI